jgi:hypothetical protein
MYVPVLDFIMVSFELGIASVQLHGQFRNRANALKSSNTGLFAVPKWRTAVTAPGLYHPGKSSRRVGNWQPTLFFDVFVAKFWVGPPRASW